tara:strand:- start:244 stop:477 length:234 start_codon:yes stop_codon:yes gene_type:complete
MIALVGMFISAAVAATVVAVAVVVEVVGMEEVVVVVVVVVEGPDWSEVAAVEMTLVAFTFSQMKQLRRLVSLFVGKR